MNVSLWRELLPIYLLAVALAIGSIIVLTVVLGMIANAPERLLPNETGAAVVFPDGWKPVVCADRNCEAFICTDGESYRYCKPMITSGVGE